LYVTVSFSPSINIFLTSRAETPFAKSEIGISNIKHYNSFEENFSGKKESSETSVYFIDIVGINEKIHEEKENVKWVWNFSRYNFSDMTKKIIESYK